MGVKSVCSSISVLVDAAKEHFPEARAPMGRVGCGWIRYNAAGYYGDVQIDQRAVCPTALRIVIKMIKDIDLDAGYNVEMNYSGESKPSTPNAL